MNALANFVEQPYHPAFYRQVSIKVGRTYGKYPSDQLKK